MGKKQMLVSLAATCLISGILLHSHGADARAGGGRSSSSSSSSSSRSYGGSSGGYSSTGSSSFSPFGFIVIAFIIFFVIKNMKKGAENGPMQNLRLNEEDDEDVLMTPASDLEEKIAALKEKDPGFNEQQFKDRTSTAFFKIQNAWCERDMNKARAYISDNVLKRFSLQLEEHKRNGVANKLEELIVDNCEMIDIRSDENFDIIDMWITASAKDYMVKADSGEYASGDKDEYATWDEKWSFIRSAGARTLMDKGVTADKCPNCGASLSINASGECDYCHSNVTKGDFDWVLSEISQLN